MQSSAFNTLLKKKTTQSFSLGNSSNFTNHMLMPIISEDSQDSQKSFIDDQEYSEDEDELTALDSLTEQFRGMRTPSVISCTKNELQSTIVQKAVALKICVTTNESNSLMNQSTNIGTPSDKTPRSVGRSFSSLGCTNANKQQCLEKENNIIVGLRPSVMTLPKESRKFEDEEIQQNNSNNQGQKQRKILKVRSSNLQNETIHE